MELINAGDRFMNTYLYPIPTGYVMVDTGYEERFAPVCQYLRQRGIALSDIRYVFLTHAHDDHAGFLKALLDACPHIRCVMSERSPEALKKGRNLYEGGGCSSRLAVHACLQMVKQGKGKHLFPSLDESYQDRFLLVSPGHTAEAEALLGGKIFFTPGHTRDSISLRVGERVFCGDAAMNGLPSLNRITMWVSDTAEFARSWEVLLGSGAKTVVPAHGKPFPLSDLAAKKHKIAAVKLLPVKPLFQRKRKK